MGWDFILRPLQGWESAGRIEITSPCKTRVVADRLSGPLRRGRVSDAVAAALVVAAARPAAHYAARVRARTEGRKRAGGGSTRLVTRRKAAPSLGSCSAPAWMRWR